MRATRKKVLGGLRVDDDEDARVRQLAKEHGMTVARWQRVRSLSTGAAAKRAMTDGSPLRRRKYKLRARAIRDVVAKPHRGKYTGRTRLIRDIVGAIVTLRRGRWTVPELAEELGMHWRSAYRLLEALQAAGVTVERSLEPQGQGGPAAYYRIPKDPLRKLLGSAL